MYFEFQEEFFMYMPWREPSLEVHCPAFCQLYPPILHQNEGPLLQESKFIAKSEPNTSGFLLFLLN